MLMCCLLCRAQPVCVSRAAVTELEADLDRARKEISQLSTDHDMALEKKDKQILQLKTLLAQFKQVCVQRMIVGLYGKCVCGKGRHHIIYNYWMWKRFEAISIQQNRVKFGVLIATNSGNVLLNAPLVFVW